MAIKNVGKPAAPVSTANPIKIPTQHPLPTGNGGNGSVPGSAADMLKQTLVAWGLSSLLPHLQEYIKSGYDSNTINLALQDTKEWKTRFAGNEQRRAAGLSVLSPAQYISMEEGYRNVMQSFGLPQGFYDSHDDFNDFIGKDISVNELQSRAQVAHDTFMNAPPEYKQMWNQYFGGTGDAIASILDPKVGTQIIQDRALQAQLGGTAKQNGFDVNAARAAEFQQHGTTVAQAQKAYSQIAQSLPTDKNIANRFGSQFGQAQEENDILLGDAAAATERQKLYSSEQALFKGSMGANQNSLGVAENY